MRHSSRGLNVRDVSTPENPLAVCDILAASRLIRRACGKILRVELAYANVIGKTQTGVMRGESRARKVIDTEAGRLLERQGGISKNLYCFVESDVGCAVRCAGCVIVESVVALGINVSVRPSRTSGGDRRSLSPDYKTIQRKGYGHEAAPTPRQHHLEGLSGARAEASCCFPPSAQT